MGYRRRKSVKILPGVKVNFNKNSTSVTIGGKHFRHTYSSTGKVTRSVSLPGSGYYTETIESGKGKKNNKRVKRVSAKTDKVCSMILFIIGAIAVFLGLISFAVGGVVFVIMGGLCILFGIPYWKRSKKGAGNNAKEENAKNTDLGKEENDI